MIYGDVHERHTAKLDNIHNIKKYRQKYEQKPNVPNRACHKILSTYRQFLPWWLCVRCLQLNSNGHAPNQR